MEIYLKFVNANNHPGGYLLEAGVVRPGMQMYPVSEDGNPYFVGIISDTATQFMLAVQCTKNGELSNNFRFIVQVRNMHLPVRVSIFEQKELLKLNVNNEIEYVLDLSSLSEDNDIRNINTKLDELLNLSQDELNKVTTFVKRIIISAEHPIAP